MNGSGDRALHCRRGAGAAARRHDAAAGRGEAAPLSRAAGLELGFIENRLPVLFPHRRELHPKVQSADPPIRWGRGAAPAPARSRPGADISDLVPMRYGLLFERFLNPDASLCRISTSITARTARRGDQVRCANTAPIASRRSSPYGKQQAKAAVRVSGQCRKPYGQVDKIASSSRSTRPSRSRSPRHRGPCRACRRWPITDEQVARLLRSPEVGGCPQCRPMPAACDRAPAADRHGALYATRARPSGERSIR